MPDQISDFYVVEFPTPHHAEQMAARLAELCVGQQLPDGPLRPVVWMGSPLSDVGRLYLSVGAVQSAHRAGLGLTPVGRVAAEQLPLHRTLLLGGPGDRAQNPS